MKEKIYVAKSYENWEKVSEPFEKDNRKYITVKGTCDKCYGSGVFGCGVLNGKVVPHPAYGGVCLKCGGKGYILKDVRLYNEKEHLAQERKRLKTEEEKKRKEEEKRNKLLEESEANKKEWFEKNGFGPDGLTWCVFGDDTFAIKDKLKELGCKYSPLLKWHSAKPLDIPAGYDMISFAFDDLCEWVPEDKNAYFLENAKEKVEKRFKIAEGPSLSEYVGEVGERLRDLTAIYKSVRGFDGRFGWTNIYTFQIGENILVWFTQKNLSLEKGAVVNLTGTVKKHEEFRGIKTTQLSRCIVEEIGE